jgi:hypothetical protein
MPISKSRASQIRYWGSFLSAIIFLLLARSIGDLVLPFYLFMGSLVYCVADCLETRRSLCEYISFIAVVFAFLINAIVQLLGNLPMPKVLFYLDLSNIYDLIIRLTWLFLWLAHCIWGYFYGFTETASSPVRRAESGVRPLPLLKLRWVAQQYTGILFPFVILPLICSVIRSALSR